LPFKKAKALQGKIITQVLKWLYCPLKALFCIDNLNCVFENGIMDIEKENIKRK